jgi:hypothetical protein
MDLHLQLLLVLKDLKVSLFLLQFQLFQVTIVKEDLA